jgi:hypothetical protein
VTSNYWQCSQCGKLHLKNAERRRVAEKFIETDSPVLGSETCEACGTKHEAEALYRGRKDPPQSDAFVANLLRDPSAKWNSVARIWTVRASLAKDDVVMLELDPATVAHYRDAASPLQLAAVALAKTNEGEPDMHVGEDGLVVPGARIKSDFPSWRVWLSPQANMWVTKRRVTWEEYAPDAAIPDALKQSQLAGPVPAVPYLVGLCVAAGLDPNKLSPIDARQLDEEASNHS